MNENHKIKAIDTIYSGYKFRSRLEATWAVFYDYLGIKYEYEKEGYDLGDGLWYLPDFWLPELNMWIEVKPEKPNAVEEQKAKRLVSSLGYPLAFAVGQIRAGKRYSGDANPHEIWFLGDPVPIGNGIKDLCCDWPYLWCRCSCGKFGLEYSARNERICGNGHPQEYLGDEFHIDPIFEAYQAAQQMRFEKHG
jgi:hypothetical protein